MSKEGNVVRAFPLAQPARYAVPPETPSDMTVQDFRSWRPNRARRQIPKHERSSAWRRIAVFAATFALIVWAVRQMYLVLSVGEMTPLEWTVLVLFSLNFAWIALSFVSATAGFLVLCLTRLFHKQRGHVGPLVSRTAVVVPVYNEPAERVFSTVEASLAELREIGEQAAFDFFVLSDTTQADHALCEETAFLKLLERAGQDAPVYYRRRRHNEARKVGNIAEFCRRWGRGYDYMIVLDADSMMSAKTMTSLAHRMDEDPGLGLLQTIPIIIGADTLFARIQQFATRAYGLVLGAGLAWWAQNEANYWGHNAIIRIEAFMTSAAMPELKGTPPFGGAVLSHDFVEAALLRRSGWKVRAAIDINGSYEECPPSLLDLSVRDRRWCQGNLQHSRLLTARGFHWVNRVHFLSGIMSYLASPLWLMLILSGFALALQAQFVRPEYFPDYFMFFPQWPIIDPARALRLFYATMGVLLVPKLYGYVLLVFDKKWRNEAGGLIHGAFGVVCETLLSALIAPIMMMLQTSAVASVLLGRDSGWKPQRRAGGKIPFSAIAKRHARHTLFGLVLTVGALSVSPDLAAWMSPALVGLLLSIPLSALTSQEGIGKAARRIGLFLTPEEVAPSPIVARAVDLRAVYAEAIATGPDIGHLAKDALSRGAHLAVIDEGQGAQRQKFDPAEIMAAAKIEAAERAVDALDLLTAPERQALVNSRRLILALAAKPL